MLPFSYFSVNGTKTVILIFDVAFVLKISSSLGMSMAMSLLEERSLCNLRIGCVITT